MSNVLLIDTAPAIPMALVGAAVALVPLAITAWRQRRAPALEGGVAARWQHALTVTTLFLTFDLILFGSFTRLSDSGLGCPDWPGCYGHASPLGAASAIDAAVQQQPDGPVTHGKAWIEMIHRYFAMAVGLLIVVLTVMGWRAARQGVAKRANTMSPWWPTLTLLWVLVQGAFGALTVTMRLYPAIVTTHLLLGMGLLALLAVQWVRLSRVWALLPGWRLGWPRAKAWLWVAAVALSLQLALGGWVSTNYAVLACQDFPKCQGVWWPPTDFEQGFQWQRELGRPGAGDASSQATDAYLPFAALTAIHLAHRWFAVVVLGLLVWLSAGLWRHAGAAHQRRLAAAVGGLALWQLLSGASNVVLGWPMIAALAHVAGAAGLVVVLTVLLAVAHRAPAGSGS